VLQDGSHLPRSQVRIYAEHQCKNAGSQRCRRARPTTPVLVGPCVTALCIPGNAIWRVDIVGGVAPQIVATIATWSHNVQFRTIIRIPQSDVLVVAGSDANDRRTCRVLMLCNRAIVVCPDKYTFRAQPSWTRNRHPREDVSASDGIQTVQQTTIDGRLQSAAIGEKAEFLDGDITDIDIP
jgi:hypothetical protein